MEVIILRELSLLTMMEKYLVSTIASGTTLSYKSAVETISIDTQHQIDFYNLLRILYNFECHSYN